MRRQRIRKKGSNFDEIGLLCRFVGALPEPSGSESISFDAGVPVGPVEIRLCRAGGGQPSARSESDSDEDREGGQQEGGETGDHHHGE